MDKFSRKHNLYFNARFLTMPTSGVQRYAIELIKALDKIIDEKYLDLRDKQITLLSPQNIKIDLKLKNINLKCVGFLKGHLWEQIELPFYARKGILINLCNTAPIILKGQIITIHDTAEFSIPLNFSFKFRKSYQILHKILSKNAKKIITVSQFSQSEIEKYYRVNKHKISITYEGSSHIENLEADDSIIKDQDLLQRPFILAVSTINPNKNFSSIIKAFNFLDGLECDLVIAGRKSDIFNQSENFAGKKAKYVGYVTDSELKSLYKHAACFIFPSFYEGFGLPPIEAMACGCPVIVSEAAAIPEICGDAALYCNPNSPEDIAKQIRKLLSDTNLQNDLRVKGLERANNFSWESCAKETIEIINDIN
jgi:glycosyltransferase involved in cell wall biosynthesis